MKKQKTPLANNLFLRRHENGLELKQVAKLLGYKYPALISDYERGRTMPGLTNAIKLMLIFDATLNELFPDLVQECRDAMDGVIKQRSFVFKEPDRIRILENMQNCTFENMLEGSLSGDEKILIHSHLVNLWKEFHHEK